MNYLQRVGRIIRILGIEDSSKMLKNYKELKVWKRIVETLIKSLEKTLEPLNPCILESFHQL